MINEPEMKNNELDNNVEQTTTIINVPYLTSGIYNTTNKNETKNKNDINGPSGDISESIINKKNSYNKLSNGISNILDSSSYKTLFNKE